MRLPFRLAMRWEFEIAPPEDEHVEISSDTETVDEGERPTGFRGRSMEDE